MRLVIPLLIVIIILLLYAYYGSMGKHACYLPISTSELKTGDVIITRWDEMRVNPFSFRALTDLLRPIFTDFWSHVGVIFVVGDQTYIYTADSDPRFDHINEKYIVGPQLLSIDYLHDYPGNVSVYRYNGDIDANQYNQMLKKMEENKNKKFDMSNINYINAVFKFRKDTRKDKILCLHSAADILKILGVIPADVSNDLIDIRDFRNYVRKSGVYDGPFVYANKYYKDKCV